jgi:hypothetical protein
LVWVGDENEPAVVGGVVGVVVGLGVVAMILARVS